MLSLQQRTVFLLARYFAERGIEPTITRIRHIDLLVRYYYDLFRNPDIDLVDTVIQTGDLPLLLYLESRGEAIDLYKVARGASGNLGLLKYAIDHGLNFHRYASLLIHDACRDGSLEIVKYIMSMVLKLGLDPDFVYIRVCLMEAAKGGYLEIVKYLFPYNVDSPGQISYFSGANKVLEMASVYGHLDIIKYIVSMGEREGEDINYSMALQEAARKGHLEIVMYLLEGPVAYRVDIHNQDNALRQAIKYNHHDVARYLKSKGSVYHIPRG